MKLGQRFYWNWFVKAGLRRLEGDAAAIPYTISTYKIDYRITE